MKPNQGRTGIHSGYTTSFLQWRPTWLKTSFVPAITAKKPSVCSTGASSQSASNSISKPGPCSCKDNLPSVRRPGQEIKEEIPGGDLPGHLSLHSPAGTKTRISFILHEFKKAASRGGYCILPLGAVGNSTSNSDRCTVQHSQLLICN